MSTDHAATSSPLSLSVNGITKRFGAQVALDDVHFQIVPGKVSGLIGQNGAGKTTLLGVVSGRYRPSAGQVHLGDSVLASADVQAAGMGSEIAVVHQEGSIIPELSVAENMMLTSCVRRPLRRITPAAATAQVNSAYAALGLAAPAASLECGLLSPADTKLLEIARAFASGAPFVLLDEPTASLDPHMAHWLLNTVRRMTRERGVGLVFVSHRLREVRAISDTLTVLRNGRVAWAGAAGLLTEAEMVRHIAGQPLDRRVSGEAPRADGPIGEIALELTGFSAPGLRPTDLTLRKGEILGVAGVEGQGQHALLYGVAGLVRHRGTVTVKGAKAHTNTRRGALASGISFLADDRGRHGLIRPMTVSDNLTVSVVPRLARWRFARHFGRENSFVAEARERFGIKMPGVRSLMTELSGGNQQKVLLARATSVNSDIVVLYEPTQGVDVDAKQEIYRLLRSLRDSGKAVVLYSSDEEELCMLCDRVIVMGAGAIVHELPRDFLSRDNIVEAMVAYSTVQVDDSAHETDVLV